MGSIYQKDENIDSDSKYLPGDLSFVVSGNEGRMLDARRTPIRIEEYFPKKGLINLRILKFEDKGNIFELPVEEINGFQFEKGSNQLNKEEVELIKSTIDKFSKKLKINSNETDKLKTNKEVENLMSSTKNWINEKSTFFNNNSNLDFKGMNGNIELINDMSKYLKQFDLKEVDDMVSLTWACQNGGEIIKFLHIIMAEMGLIDYDGKIIRDEKLLNEKDKKETLRVYVIHRLSFVRSFMEMLNIKNLTLFRGMSSEKGWKANKKAWSSWTPLINVANNHADFEGFGQHQGKSTDSYLLKRTFPIEKIFMSYFETEGFNRQWKETEVIILHDKNDSAFL